MFGARVDAQQKAIDGLIEKSVTREELAKYMEQTREDRRTMHEDNRTNLVGLRDDVRAQREDVRAIQVRIDKIVEKK